MEFIFYIVAFYFGFYLLGQLFSFLEELNEKRKSKIRNQVAKEIIQKTDITSELLMNYKNKLQGIGFSGNQEYNEFYRQVLSDGIKSHMGLVGKCPACNKGDLIVRKGMYGKFIGCTSYPSCKYAFSIKKAKEEYKKGVQDEFFNDIRKAYS